MYDSCFWDGMTLCVYSVCSQIVIVVHTHTHVRTIDSGLVCWCFMCKRGSSSGGGAPRLKALGHTDGGSA